MNTKEYSLYTKFENTDVYVKEKTDFVEGRLRRKEVDLGQGKNLIVERTLSEGSR